MSYIPNVREKRHFSFKTGKYDGEENYYRQEYLNKEDMEYRRGYDFAVETARNFFNNLDAYREEFLEAGVDTYSVNTDIITSEDASKEDVEKLSKEERILGTVFDCLLDFLENERNMLVVSMIDNMDEKEFSRIRKEVLEREKE